MKKSKTVFAVLTVIVIFVMVAAIVLSRCGAGQQSGPSDGTVPASSGTLPVDDSNASGMTVPPEDRPDEPSHNYATFPSEEEREPSKTGEETDQLPGNVRMERVDVTGEIIHDPQISPDHPEYIDTYGGDPYFCDEGIVFRNDRKVTISIDDPLTGDTFDISFGYPAGTYNRFLYLSPDVERNGKEDSNNYFFHFDVPKTGSVLIMSDDSIETNRYAVGRALESRFNANYVDPKHPGVVWHSNSGALFDPIYVYCRMMRYNGDLAATLRITILKLADGTFAIYNLEDMNLIANPEYSEVYHYNEQELEYLVNLANDTYNDSDLTHISFIPERTFDIDACLVELRSSDTGLYYGQFFSQVAGDDMCRFYSRTIPVLAVTLRDEATMSKTLYFWQNYPPCDGEHGAYQYIGMDFPSYDTEENLRNNGWTGHYDPY